MPALQREAAWAEERLSGDPRQSVPQNSRVHLLGIEGSAFQMVLMVAVVSEMLLSSEIQRRDSAAEPAIAMASSDVTPLPADFTGFTLQ